MDGDQNWYRQLAALVLLSASRAAVEFITNPNSRDDAGKQLKSAFAEIDYDAVANALTAVIENLAETSKDRLSDTIDSLRDSGVDAVTAAQTKAEQQLAAKPKKGKKMRFLFGLLIGGLIAYFVFDEQRRDDLLDKLTGASGPIQPTTQNWSQTASSAAQSASHGAEGAAASTQQAASTPSETTQSNQ